VGRHAEDASERVSTGEVGRRQVLKGSGAAALGISALALPSAAQAFSLTVSGQPVAGVTVYWSERGTVGSANGRIGRLTYGGSGSISNLDNAWFSSLESPRSLTTDGTALYYTSWRAGTEQGIWRVDIIDKTRERIVPDVIVTTPFVDATHIYYGTNSSILRIAKDGSGTATTLYAFPGSSDWPDYRAMVVSDDTLYVTDWTNGQVLTLPKNGGTPSLLASVTECQPIQVSGGVVYVGEMPGNRRVHRFTLDGTPLGSFGIGGYVQSLQVLDTVLFSGTSNSGWIAASGLDGGNIDYFAGQGSDPQTIVGFGVEGIAVLP
jgi:hypothetical protein